MEKDRIYSKFFLTMLVGMFSFFMASCSEEKPEACYIDVYTDHVDMVTQTKATLYGSIYTESVTAAECGFYLSNKKAELETAAAGAKKVVGRISNGTFTYDATGLSSGTPYYFRAFASNGNSAVYGNIMEFNTLAPSVPTLGELQWSNVTDNSVDLSCTLVDAGVENTQTMIYGFAYRKSDNANWTKKTDGVQKDEDGSFSLTLDGLSPETGYYICAYVTNSHGDGYSNETWIETSKKLTPEVQMDDIRSGWYEDSDVTATGVKVSGYINKVYSEDSVVSEVGFLYGTDANLTYASAGENRVVATPNTYGEGGAFTAELVNKLLPNTQYYIRPYAKDEGSDGNSVFGYGDVKSFTTREFESPRLGYMSADTVKTNSIFVSVPNMTYDGALVEYGFIWRKAQYEDGGLTLENCGENKITFTPVGGEVVSAFSALIENLETNTKYQIKAYAISSYVVDGETHNGESGYASIECTTADLHTPSLNYVELKKSTYASLYLSSGVYSYDETAILTECGFIWMDNETYEANGYTELTLENCGENKIVAEFDENNAFECTISDLVKGTTYRVAAYVTVTYPSGETRTGYYKNTYSTIELSAPSLNSVEHVKATYMTLSVKSSIYSYDEAAELTECGFIWMDNETYEANEYTELTLDNCGENKLLADLDESNAFNGTITGLSVGTEYRVVAFATVTYSNGEKKTGYANYYGGWYSSFLSTSNVPMSVSTSDIGANSFTVSATIGEYWQDNNWEELGENLEAGFCWATKEDVNPANIPEENRQVAEITDYSDYQKQFISTISVEESGSLYYVWAYLKYEGGIIYSGRINVTSKNIPGKGDHGDPTIKE